jgi:hypothetical protein
VPMDDAPLDPILAATLRWVQAHDDTPAPDPAFIACLEETLMHHVAVVAPHQPATAAPNLTPSANGRWGEQIAGPVRPLKLPRARLAIAAVVLVLFSAGSGLVVNQHFGPSDPRDTSPRLAALQVATPDAGLCSIPPRTAGPSDETTVHASVLPPPGGHGYPVITSDDQIPRGAAAPPDVVAGIIATLRVRNACNEEYPGESTEISSTEALSRELAFYSDDYLRRVPTVGPPPTPQVTSRSSGNYPPAWYPRETPYMEPMVQQAWLLPDGRASAIVGDRWGSPVVAVFVRVGSWWLIDELAVLAIDEAQSAATPVLRLPLASDITAVPDQGFSPSQVVIRPDQDVVVTVHNLELVQTVNFTIDALGISVDIEPGASADVTINAQAGVYAFYSDILGQAQEGLIGTLLVADVVTEPPHREAPPS